MPLTDPGRPDLRSPARFLLWIAKGQWGLLTVGMICGVLWMPAQALIPAALGKAIDEGVAASDTAALVRWSLVLLGLGVLQAAAGSARHYMAVTNWLTASFRTEQLVVRHVSRFGGSLTRQVSTGEIVAIGASDMGRVGSVFDISARFAGAIVSFVIVALILMTTSLTLGVIVLVAVPGLMVAVLPLLRPLQRREAASRELVGRLTTIGSDTVAGLRVLRGIGGEATFAARYADASQQVRRAGLKVGQMQATLESAQVFFPGLLVVFVTWLGARLAVQGELSPGELVAFYGYAAFLVLPLRTTVEAVQKLTRGLVAAGRVVRVLRLEPELRSAAEPATPPGSRAELADPASGLVVPAGQLAAVVSAVPEESSALAARLSLTAETDAMLGGVRLDELALDTVRQRILLHDTEPRLFTGRLREELDPTGHTDDATIHAAIHAAAAEDVLDALPDELDSEVEERGRSFSGGQRQRLALTRALLANPEILIMDEPTSAVDAHTEARIADRLRAARAGRTTVVMTTSPLVLDRVDRVALLLGGRVVATGPHRELLTEHAGYRETVIRGEED
ncbi:MAG TPA: ABC transporter ATP-binding protein [Actinomycetes bacterium]|jgi:ABC-type multidrug transport system fused ATPase/permease subunit|nr:ABC transporter ATP-binding protein [Actinomycetes bacterium]